MVDDELDFESMALPSKRFQPVDVAVTGLSLLYQVSQSITNALETLTDLAGMHANYRVDQRQFAEEARRSIETIAKEE